ncbi:MAG: OmpA family protein [Pseudomonadota bacterium]
MFKMLVIVSCAIALASLNANGQDEIKPQFNSSDVLKHFEHASSVREISCPAGELCLPKKKSRGLCIGTASKCGSKREAAERSGGFDLLVTFELGSDLLSATAQANLSEFARALNAPGMARRTFYIEGHTDARGADSLNKVLSERRAAIVVEFLQSLGVEPERLRPRGFGESRPRIKSDPFAGVNRRVEATLRAK